MQNIVQSVTMGDWESLRIALEKAGLPSEEITALKSAVDEDQKQLGKPAMDGATGRWYTGLLGKIGRGTLKVGLNIGTSVVGTALGHYMGINS